MTPEILKAMKEVWRIDSDRNKATMLWAAACTCFFGFLRSVEVVPSDSEYDAAVHLSFGDVRLDNTTDPQFLEVTIKASKTDPFRQGVQVYLGRTVTLPMVPPQSVPPDQVRQPWMVPADHTRQLHLVQGGPSTALRITTLGPPLPRTVPHRRTIH